MKHYRRGSKSALSTVDAPVTQPLTADGTVTERLTARPNRAPELRVYPLGEEALVYVPAGTAAYTLNRSAWAVFEMCDGQRTVADIGQECAQTLGCAPEALLGDVQHAVRELREAGLVTCH
jgi:hypothetical protein